MNEKFWQELKDITTELVMRILKKHGFFNLYDDGKINALSADGKTADVYINGDTTVTPSVPIRPGLTLAVGDEVRIININFNKRDKLIDHKKVL